MREKGGQVTPMDWLPLCLGLAMILAISWVVVRSGLLSPAPVEHSQMEAVTGAREPVSVLRVLDGDTLEISIGGNALRVRIIGIDAPEVAYLGERAECYGAEAAERAEDVLLGQTVYLVADPTQDERDRYRRILRYVELDDGTDFGLLMLEEGYAREYTANRRFPYERQTEYRTASRVAMASCRGLNTDCADPAYPEVCIPSPPPQLGCLDIPFRRFAVLEPDPHHFDAEGDGLGCEW